ncbi:hypothetical protein TNCV_825971 [Trichonephila clavipes]|nr:hypothetical protein TNCV_825971 [Trichonephila clavipes]
MACPKYSVACHHWHACHWFAIPALGKHAPQFEKHFTEDTPCRMADGVWKLRKSDVSCSVVFLTSPLQIALALV